MSTNSSFIQGPNDYLNYGCDATRWLSGGDTIVASTWTVPSGITTNQLSFTTTTTAIWVTGGTPGTSYPLVNQITTAQGLIRHEVLTIIIALP